MTKFIFIFEMADGLTEAFHSGGGVVVIASSVEEAKILVKKINPENKIKRSVERSCNLVISLKDTELPEPIYTAALKDDQEPRLFLFPDAGCC